MEEKKKWKEKIASLLWKMFDLQYGGAPGTKFRWMQGFTDGYIQAYIDMGIAGEKEVLALIQSERARFLERFSTSSESCEEKAA